MLTSEDQNEIERGKAQHRADIETVRADRRLSDEGKRQRLAQLWAAEKRRVDAVREAAQERASTRRAQLERKLFSLPNHADANDTALYRDALDRVEKITEPGQLAQLVNRAVSTGDKALARAGVARSYGQYNATRTANRDKAQAWRNAAAPWIAAAPDAERQALTELDDIDAAASDSRRTMRESMLASVPRPTEIAHLPEHTVEGMADNPTPA